MGAFFYAGVLNAVQLGTNMVQPGIPAVLQRIGARV
jgi:hypothetical protein